MPVSGNEETVVKPILRQPSDYIAGVPIKKRRYPSLQPTSPPQEEKSLLPSDGISMYKEQSSPSQSQGSAFSNTSVVTTSGLSDTNKMSLDEENSGKNDIPNANIVQGSIGYSAVKLEEPTVTARSVFLGSMERQQDPGVAMNSGLQTPLEKTKLNLEPNDSLADKLGKEILGTKQIGGKSKSEISMIPGNTKLSLGLKEHLAPALGVVLSDGNCKSQEPVAQNLSLTKQKSGTQCESADLKLNTNASLMQSSRANWDLNTVMEWEGCLGDAPAENMSVGGMSMTVRTHDIRPVICSSGMVSTDTLSGKRSVSKSENGTRFGKGYKVSEQYDSLNLRLSSSSNRPDVSEESSTSSVMLDSGRNPNLSLHRMTMPLGNLSTVNRTVKSEPVDESIKMNFKGDKANQMGLSDGRIVKHGVGEQCNLEAMKSSNISNLVKLAEPRLVKSEPVHDGCEGTPHLLDGTRNQSKKPVIRSEDNIPIPLTSEISGTYRKNSCMTELTINVDASSHIGHPSHSKGVHLNPEASKDACETRAQQATPETINVSKGWDDRDFSVFGVVDTERAEDDLEQCRLKFRDERPLGLQGNGEETVSDEEKINISNDILEEDSYSSDYESDGNQTVAKAMDDAEGHAEVDNDYEDGEVREPRWNIKVEDPLCEKRKLEYFDHVDSGNKKMNSMGKPGQVRPTLSHVDKDNNTEVPGETNNDGGKDCVDTNTCNTVAEEEKKDVCMQESAAVEEKNSQADVKRPIKATLRRQSDQSKGHETSSDQATNKSQISALTASQGVDEKVGKPDFVQQNELATHNVEQSANVNSAAKEASGGSNRSRIINLPRAPTASSPGKTRSISGRSFPPRNGRERLPDGPLEREIFHPRGRDDTYSDNQLKFSRDRNRELSSRNSRLNFIRGRGRLTRCLNTLRDADWELDREFAPENYRGATEYRGPRHKYILPAVSDTDLECNTYKISQDDGFVGPGRGEKVLNDEGPIFRHISSRRRSRGGRNGPSVRGIRMVRGTPRYNGSPSRCIDEDGSELVGLRHSEKFVRDYPDNMVDPMVTCPQSSYEDAHFARENRNFSSFQRRGLPYIRSKSPIRSRNHSPGPWLSPRRRSPNGFVGHPEMAQQRSSPIYRVDRMRSPDRASFRGEIGIRRHVSPSYMSRPPPNDLRDVDRSINFNRNPRDRLLLRNRRVDVMDPRERIDNEGYLGGPGDGNGDDRRFGERRGPIRTFRPPYNGGDGENFHINAEDGPRPFRFCSEEDPEFHERGSLREKDFERRIKRPGDIPRRRTRSIEEQEGNRHGGRLWHGDNGFDDISRVKRKRF